MRYSKASRIGDWISFPKESENLLSEAALKFALLQELEEALRWKRNYESLT
jgi:hypothetical protein